jgi:hypothetical protein
MEARLICAAFAAASLLSLGASHRTENFLVTAPSQEFAKQVAESAEQFRTDLAIEWLGHELPPWRDKCPITMVNVGPQYGAGGATSFMFENGRPFGWTMTLQGSKERILDSVLPHEVTHTVFATHFGRPLPRWADEGACTTVEHVSERQKQHDMLYEFLTTHRGIAFNKMFKMTEYPPDVLPLYSQGYSLARFLIAQSGKREFLDFVGDGMKWNNWTKATQQHYGYRSLSELQVTWLEWVRRGSPKVESQPDLIAKASRDSNAELVPVAAAEIRAEPESKVVPVSLASDAKSIDDRKGDERSTGWYSRVRDQAVATRGNQQDPPVARTDLAARSGKRDIAPSQSLARPQPIGRPRQIVLEWSRPATYPGPAPPRPARTSRLVPNFGQTFRR